MRDLCVSCCSFLYEEVSGDPAKKEVSPLLTGTVTKAMFLAIIGCSTYSKVIKLNYFSIQNSDEILNTSQIKQLIARFLKSTA